MPDVAAELGDGEKIERREHQDHERGARGEADGSSECGRGDDHLRDRREGASDGRMVDEPPEALRGNPPRWVPSRDVRALAKSRR